MSPALKSHSTNTMRIRSRAPRTAPETRRRQLLDTAEGILEAEGSDALKMDMLAKAAGVTRPVVYEHFSNRDDLIVALIERHAERLREGEKFRLAEASSVEDVLRSATRAYLSNAVAHGPAMRALVSGERMSPAIEQARRRLWDRGASHWSEIYRTEFQLRRMDARALAVSHLAGLSALAGLCIDGILSVNRAVDLHVTSSLGALMHISTGRVSE